MQRRLVILADLPQEGEEQGGDGLGEIGDQGQCA